VRLAKAIDVHEGKAAGADIRVCPVPYRRETNGQMQEFALADVAVHGSGFAGWMEPLQPTAAWGAEGWVWSKDDASLLIAKYNADSMEWSLMEPLVRSGETQVRFGGAGAVEAWASGGIDAPRPGRIHLVRRNSTADWRGGLEARVLCLPLLDRVQRLQNAQRIRPAGSLERALRQRVLPHRLRGVRPLRQAGRFRRIA